MPTLSDDRFDSLRGQGFTGSTSDMLLQWLQANGATSNAVPDAWRDFLLALTGLPAEDYHRNDYWWAYLDGLVPADVGRNLSDMEAWFWDPNGGGGVIGDLVNAGGPYSGFEKAAIQLSGTVIFVDDPAPTILWTIESGGTGTFSDASIVNPTFTPDLPGPYVLRLTGTGVPAGALFDLANLTSVARQDVTFIGNLAPFDLTVDVPITPRDVSPAYEGDWTPFVYTLTGTAWPAWASIDANTGIITGTPDTVEMTSGHTVTATDADANTAVSNTFDINVVAAPVPVEFTGNIADIVGVVDTPITPVQAWQEFNGTETPITFTSQGVALPDGLVLSSAGVISGTPTADGITAGHIVRATDTNLDTADSNTFGADISEVPAGDVPIFQVDLQTTAVPEIATGDDTITFARNSAKTVVDFEGYIRTVVDDEIAFRGARRVENFVSNDYTLWAPGSGANIGASGLCSLPGVSFAEYIRYVTSPIDFSSHMLRYALDIRAQNVGSEGKTVKLQIQGSGPTFNNYGARAVTLTTGWQRFTANLIDIVDDVSSGIRVIINNEILAGLVEFEIRQVQIELVDGQANDAPGEFVDETLEHGANALGVKYFKYANGNTVDVNGVVTEAQGLPFDATDFYNDANGPWGYDAEDAATNLLWPSEDVAGTNWFNQNTAIDNNAAIGHDGAMSMQRLGDDGDDDGVQNVYVQYPITVAVGEDNVASVFAKQDQLQHLLMKTLNFDAAANADTWFDLSAGTVGTTGHDDAGIEALAGGIYRCWARFNPASDGVGNVRIAVTSQNGGAATVPTDGTSSIFVGGVMIEEDSFPTSYIKTEATIVSRSRDFLTYPTASNFNDAEGTLNIEAATNWETAIGTQRAFNVGIPSSMIFRSAGGVSTQISTSDGTTQVNTSGAGGEDMYQTLQQLAISWGPSGNFSPSFAGNAEVRAFDGSWSPNVSMGIGCRYNGVNPWRGNLRFVKIYDVEDPTT